MSDPATVLKAVAKVAPDAIDLAGDGLLRDLREQLLPDVEGLLRRKANDAFDAMWTSLILVVRALVAAAHGVGDNDVEVWRFINGAAQDPAFAARRMRLLSQGVRTPNERRRRMLAVALFRPRGGESTRDRVDAAIEKLEPADVELLRKLVEDEDSHGYGHELLSEPMQANWFFGIKADVEARRLTVSPGKANEPRSYSTAAIINLRAAGCVDTVEPGGFASSTDGGRIIMNLYVLPLGRDVLDVLKDERAIADIEDSATRGAERP